MGRHANTSASAGAPGTPNTAHKLPVPTAIPLWRMFNFNANLKLEVPARNGRGTRVQHSANTPPDAGGRGRKRQTGGGRTSKGLTVKFASFIALCGLASVQILLRAGLPPVPGIDSDGRPLGSSLIERITRRKRVRRLRAMDNAAATTVQCMVRGKLSRRCVQRARSAKALTQRHVAAKRIQRAWHAYEKRGTWWQGAARQKHDAASAIQAVWRGTAARLHLKQQLRDNMVWQRRCRAAMLLQAFARGFVARRQVAAAKVQLREAQHLTARQHSSAVVLQCLARGWVPCVTPLILTLLRRSVAISRAATVPWNARAFDVLQLEDGDDPAPPYPSGNDSEDAPQNPGVHSEQESQRPHPNQEPED
ncbi:hypothetical protein JKP88DRAFT_308988 [Tribonema minus]|uniref:Uncharacterized protein n=1 Tax=Tribonema minus TaxID=303371 RepID=A0A836CKF6_9STRA|nr:hypothetical protein JKP88DRAFT_308988 [Tribonema minus]